MLLLIYAAFDMLSICFILLHFEDVRKRDIFHKRFRLYMTNNLIFHVISSSLIYFALKLATLLLYSVPPITA